jgi:hypothetical protein
MGVVRPMKIVWRLFAVLLAASLPILPLSGALAKTFAVAPEAHAIMPETAASTSSDDCPCCDASRKCLTEQCFQACGSTAAILAGDAGLVPPHLPALVEAVLAAAMPFSSRPDSPPPRT